MNELPELSAWLVNNPDIPFKRFDRLIDTYHSDLLFHSGFCISRDRTPVTVKAKLYWVLMGVIECNKR